MDRGGRSHLDPRALAAALALLLAAPGCTRHDDRGDAGGAVPIEADADGPAPRTAEPLATAAADPPVADRDAARPLDLLLVVVDTLRADHLGAFGYGLPTSPRLDALAARGAAFTQAIAPSSWTRTSMASVMTGVLPTTTGLTCANFRVPRSSCDVLDGDLVTLAELLREHGFDTAGVVANINVDPVFGFDQGFDEYVFVSSDLAGDDPDWRRSDDWMRATTTQVTEEALRWLRARDASGDDDPYLLYLHYLDPHHPYDPPRTSRGAFALDAYADAPAESRAARALYDAEILHVDTSFGRVLDRLEADGRTDRTGVVVLSDHGEEFLDHGGRYHGFTLYEEQIRVPLIAVLPGVTRPGTRVHEQVGLIDVAPTLLELAGAPVPEWMAGTSLLGALRGEADVAARGMLSERAYVPLASWRRPPWKLIRDLESGAEMLFMLDADPGEQKDVAARHPDLAAELRDELLAARARAEELAARVRPAAGDEAIELSAEQIEQLRALGYVDPGGR